MSKRKKWSLETDKEESTDGVEWIQPQQYDDQSYTNLRKTIKAFEVIAAINATICACGVLAGLVIGFQNNSLELIALSFASLMYGILSTLLIVVIPQCIKLALDMEKHLRGIRDSIHK